MGVHALRDIFLFTISRQMALNSYFRNNERNG